MSVSPVNSTMVKFGHPDTVIAETEHWTVQLRPQQVTLGSLVLISREPVLAFGDVSPEGFAGLKPAVDRIEKMLRKAVAYQKINYLMLMMLDPDVHFHVIPRYEGSRNIHGVAVSDVGWPGPPRLDKAVTPDGNQTKAIVDEFKRLWPES